MFPRESVLVQVKKKIFGLKPNPSVYGNIHQTFYAHSTDRIRLNVDMWKEQKESGKEQKESEKEKKESEVEEKWETVKSNEYEYFRITTSVGVGAKGRNNIRRIHVRFRLIPMHEEIHDPEVLSIYPHSISRPAGWINYFEQIRKELEVALQARVDAGGQIGRLRSMFQAMTGKRVEETRDYSLPYHVVIANASGTGNRAMWEFYQKEGMAAIGQFDLEIYFRIRSQDFLRLLHKKHRPSNAVIRDLYCVDWNVEVNSERLVDHNIDKKSSFDMKVNGRLLMDKYQDFDNPNPKKLDDKGYYAYWNVPVRDKTNEGPREKRKATEKQILKWMCEEDPKAESQKMLRPLYLVFTSHEGSQTGSQPRTQKID
jgi:hypothetical protein